jgi:hypothetical protein
MELRFRGGPTSCRTSLFTSTVPLTSQSLRFAVRSTRPTLPSTQLLETSAAPQTLVLEQALRLQSERVWSTAKLLVIRRRRRRRRRAPRTPRKQGLQLVKRLQTHSLLPPEQRQRRPRRELGPRREGGRRAIARPCWGRAARRRRQRLRYQPSFSLRLKCSAIQR